MASTAAQAMKMFYNLFVINSGKYISLNISLGLSNSGFQNKQYSLRSIINVTVYFGLEEVTNFIFL